MCEKAVVGGGVITEQGPQGGGQQPEAYANSGPTRCPPHNHIVLTEEGQDFQHEQWFIFWIGPHQKTCMPCASPRSHFSICGPLCQAVLRPKVHVDVCGPTTAGAMLMSRAYVTAKVKPTSLAGSAPKSTLISMGHAAARGHIDVRDLPELLWSMRSPRVMVLL